MTENQFFTLSLLIIAIIFLMGIGLIMFAWMNSKENRRRDREERQEVVREARMATEAAAHAAREANLAVREARTNLEAVRTSVVDVGVKADAAYKEANQSNLKIQSVQDALTKVLEMPQKDITESTITKDQ